MTEIPENQPPLSQEELVAFRDFLRERSQPKRLVIGMTGASGTQWGIRLLEVLYGNPRYETHLIISDGAKDVMKYEMDYTTEDLERIGNLASRVYDNHDMAAAVSSGSFKTEGMVVIPCSVKTLEEIASGNDESLISRAAYCTLKEGRKLILVPRETPTTLEYLRNLVRAKENGATILLPVPAFYHRPKTVDDIINQTVGRVLDQFGIDANLYRRWGTQ